MTAHNPKSAFARYDPVTYLPNRQQFIAHYEKVRTESAQLVMVTVADATQFNELLRALGHDYSEDFVRAAAARIRDHVPGDIDIFHVSVLSFAFICPDDTERVIADLVRCGAAPLVCGGIPIMSRFGIGVVNCLDASAAGPLRKALAACQDSRRNTAGWARYDNKSDHATRRSFTLLTDLPAAMAASDQLSLVYQPKYDLRTGKPAGVEALLRWQHPQLGPVPPAEFVPLTEKTGLITDLTLWVLKAAAAQAAAWRDAGLALNMAINVSPENLSEPGFAERFATLLADYRLAPSAFELEFTEGRLASNDNLVRAQLRRLRASGAHVALDDFGTGFSNLSYITHLPADILKIDRAFIRLIEDDERTAALVRMVIELAHRLDYRVVAEGIETGGIYRLLAGWGCDEGQGYYMSRPVPAADVPAVFSGAAITP